MATHGKPQITTGSSLDVQPGVGNIGENQAQLEALRQANIDGQDVYPQSVSTRRFSAEDGAFSGNIYSGSLMVGSGGMLITSGEPGESSPTTGLVMSDSVLSLFSGGASQVTLNGATGAASFTGTINATAGSFPGSLVTGYLQVGSGGIVVTSDAGGGVPTTGVYIGASQIKLIKSGAVTVLLDGATGDATFKGSITASSISSMSSVNFGTSITVGGDVVINATSVDGRIYFDGAAGNAYLDYESDYGGKPAWGIVHNSSTGHVGIAQGDATSWAHLYSSPHLLINDGTIYIQNDGPNGGSTTTRDIAITIGSTSGNQLRLGNATSTVMSFVGNSNTVTFAYGITIAGPIAGATTIGASGAITCGSISAASGIALFATCKANHKTVAGAQKADTTFSFGAYYADFHAARVHTVTFADGLITSWSVVDY